jgi:hypothetical protein
MTKDAALRLALEALEKLFGIPDKWTGEGAGDVAVWRLGGSYRAQQAIAAIKAVLEAKDGTVTVYGYCPICNAEGLSRERHPDGSDVCTNGHIYKSKDALTTPPQRTWVGLTDDEWNELYDEYVPLKHYARLMEAIEAKLKEKNT